MSEDKITFEDVKEYEGLFLLAPSFLLEGFAKKNTNLAGKFKTVLEGYFNNLTEEQLHKLDLILKADTDELQAIMNESYQKTNKKQFKILGNPKYKPFIESNISEIRKLVNES